MCSSEWVSYVFCFKQKSAYETGISDWSSDVALPISHHDDVEVMIDDLEHLARSANDRAGMMDGGEAAMTAGDQAQPIAVARQRRSHGPPGLRRADNGIAHMFEPRQHVVDRRDDPALAEIGRAHV